MSVVQDSIAPSKAHAVWPPLLPALFWAGTVLAGTLPLLARFSVERWVQPHYQFFPLMILAAAYIGWQRLQEVPLGSFAPGSRLVSRGLLALSFMVLGVATVWWAAYFAAVAALIALTGIAWQLGGIRMLRTLAPSLILLALIVGMPIDTEAAFLWRMRAWAVGSSSVALVWMHIPHLISGTVMEIPGSRLLVAEACSGINSMMAVMGFTLVLGFLRRRSPAVIAMLVGAGIVWVLWANMVRIAGGAWLKAAWDIDILSGDVHMWASLVLFSICMGLVFCTDELIILVQRWRETRRWQFRGGAAPIPEPAVFELPAQSAPVNMNITRGLWSVAFVFALVGAAQFARGMSRGELTALLRHGTSLSALRAGAVFTVPDQLAGWEHFQAGEKQMAQPELEGKQSQAWVYRQGDQMAVVAIDYSFRRYHDLTSCYRGSGWNTDDFVVTREQGSGDDFAVVKATRLSERGYLHFAAVDESGQWMAAPPTAAESLRDRVRTNYQIQVWAQTYTPLTEAQQGQLEQLFLAVRQDLAKQVLSQLQK